MDKSLGKTWGEPKILWDFLQRGPLETDVGKGVRGQKRGKKGGYSGLVGVLQEKNGRYVLFVPVGGPKE